MLFTLRRLRPLACRLAAMLIAVGLASVASACPNCRDSLAESDPQGQSLAAGFYYSILFMISMPVLIASAWGAAAYRAIKRARVEQTGDSAL